MSNQKFTREEVKDKFWSLWKEDFGKMTDQGYFCLGILAEVFNRLECATPIVEDAGEGSVEITGPENLTELQKLNRVLGVNLEPGKVPDDNELEDAASGWQQYLLDQGEIYFIRSGKDFMMGALWMVKQLRG